MIEAVNAAISSAILLRGSSDQINVNRGSANAASSLGSVQAPQAPSLDVEVDYDYDKAVLRVLDGNTGDVLSQFPSKETLAERAQNQERTEEARAEQRAQEARGDNLIRVDISAIRDLSSSAGRESRTSGAASSSTARSGADRDSVSASSAKVASAALSSASSVQAKSGSTINISA